MQSSVPNFQSSIFNFQLVVIGVSLGGLHALEVLLAGLPKEFPVPVAVVQHRQKGSDDTLAVLLQRFTALTVGEAEDKEAILPGHIYLAPPDYHLLVEEDHFALSTEAPVEHARPSIDLLFESAADAYAKNVIGVILTGASQDGARGLTRIKERGGLTVVQDPATAESHTMPEAAIVATDIDKILPIEEIGPFLAVLCRGGNPRQ